MINIRYSIIILFIIAFTFSCSKNIKTHNGELIQSAARVLEDNPKQSLELLKQVKTERLNEKDYNYFILLQVETWDKLEMNILSSKDAVTDAKEYFIRIKDIDKTVLAYFLAARICEKQNEEIKALYYYQSADELAKKINYKVADFNYVKIPYNIARLLYYEKYYQNSNNYLDKALKNLGDNTTYSKYRLYLMELKGLNLGKLDLIDSSLFYFDQALHIANYNNDINSKSRLNYNKCALYFIAKDYDLTERNCNATIEKTSITDSINLGRLYLAQAAIYEKTNRTDSAYTSIYKAKELLVNAKYDTQVLLLKILSKTEKQRNNQNKSEEYKKQYFSLKDDYENAQHTEATELKAEIAKQKEQQQADMITVTLSAIHSNWLLWQKHRTHTKIAYSVIAVLILGMGLLTFRLLKVKRDDREIEAMRKLGKETLLRNILQRRDLIVLLEQLDEYIHNSKSFSKEDLEVLADKIDGMIPQAYWDDNPLFLKVHFRTMFENFKTDFPMLNELEYRILCLTCTQIFEPAEIVAILRIDEKEYQQARQTMEDKIKTKGYRLNDLMAYAQGTFDVVPETKLL